MANRGEVAKQELIGAVVRLVRERHDDERAVQAERFVRQYFRDVPPDDILGLDLEQLYGAALSLLAFCRRRTPGAPRVRVFSPRIDEHGWASEHAVVEMVNDDMPFLVDSVTAALAGLDLTVLVVIHPIFHVRRSETGDLIEIIDDGAEVPPDARAESVIHLEITEQTDPAVLTRIQREMETVLAEVRTAVQDWPVMIQRVHLAVADLEGSPAQAAVEDFAEVRDFLNWLLDNHFTFLGYRHHSFTWNDAPAPGSGGGGVTVGAGDGLGILRNPDNLVFEELRHLTDLPAEVSAFLAQPTHLLITKASKRARVHRPVHMDVIGLKRFGDDGRVAGIHLFVGLFTANVYTNSPSFVPVLRRKIERVIKRAGFRPHSHDGKRLVATLENLPRDELFQCSDDKLLEIAVGILHLQDRQRTALFLRLDEFERFASALVFVPRDRYDTHLRLTVKTILEETLGGVLSAYYTQVADGPLARLHFIVRTTAGRIPAFDPVALEARIAAAARDWSDHLRDAIVQAKGEEQGHRLARRWVAAFPGFYAERTPPQAAVFDIDRMEDCLAACGTEHGGGGVALNLHRPLEAADGEVHFKIYHRGAAVPLSDILPVLENMGFRVMGEVPYEIQPFGLAETVWIHDFTMQAATPGGGATAVQPLEGVEVGAIRAAFHDAFARVWAGEAENDGFNRLVVAAGLTWREVVVLRAYAHYMRQAAFTFSQGAIERALALHPGIARGLVRLFHARFDPTGAGGDPALYLARVTEALDAVVSPDEDRILRRFLNLITATLRTNFYQQAEGRPKPWLSFKIDSRAVEDLPLPRPMVEVWVYSPRVEAVHLRGGKVARGGIRWSDRREDFRTEILGLMKAQMVKNAVIVPVGSKGGFVVKQPPAGGGREALLAEGIACYQTFIRGLLDLTDNIGDGGAVVPPPDVVRHDDDDPYLVVAADKGTATFSDIANAVSAEYGFWLTDAFASGGSQGYDHKAMGITARGAWEAVKRHFREMGIDTQSQDFTVIGVGDMSGDVFGNGMLNSRHIRLLAAFDHRHIFIDPDPDPAVSFSERERLFALPRSSWADYDPACISEGGGVLDRAAKRVKLTPQMRALCGLGHDIATPAEVIGGLLRAPVDLLWFGGIGTYVKASDESHADAGDRANDAIRVDGRAVRAKVIGEGANLGMTQRGRIEYALKGAGGAGGRLNTDAIDNSAGVDCSDHEVNIKILLDRVVADGDMTAKQRNQLLAAMTEEVGALVLRDNYLQTQAISLSQARGVELLDHQQRLMKMLEKAGRLDRAIEFLPDDDTLAERQAAQQGLTRPELAVVMAYAKLWLFDQILASDLPDDPAMLADLVSYFPGAVQERFSAQIDRHKLHREIAATHATNSMINRVGGTFVTQIMEKTGMPPAAVARAYIVIRDAFGLRDLWRDIEALDNRVDTATQYALYLEANRVVERGTLWLLRHAAWPLDTAGLTAALAEGAAAMDLCMDGVCPLDVRNDVAGRLAGYQAAGVPEALATRVAHFIVLASTPDIVRLASDMAAPVPDAAQAYFAVGSRFGLGWLRAQAEGLAERGSHWEKLAVSAVIDEVYTSQRMITRAAMQGAGPGAAPDDALERWIDGCRPAVERADQLIAELRAANAFDLAMLTVASRQLAALRGG